MRQRQEAGWLSNFLSEANEGFGGSCFLCFKPLLLLAFCFAGRALPAGGDLGDLRVGGQCRAPPRLEPQPPGTAPVTAGAGGFEAACVVVREFAHASMCSLDCLLCLLCASSRVVTGEGECVG